MRARLLLAFWILAGCDRSTTPQSSTPDAGPGARVSPTAPPSAPPPTASAAPLTSTNPVSGAVSEEEFKSWHTLKADAAAPAEGRTVELPDGSTAYLSLPSGKQPPLAGLVVVHEWWGLNEHIKHYADRF